MQFAGILQTKWQLVSPLIPDQKIEMVIHPYIITGIFSSFMVFPALILYRYKRYIWMIALTVLVLVFQQVYPYADHALFFAEGAVFQIKQY